MTFGNAQGLAQRSIERDEYALVGVQKQVEEARVRIASILGSLGSIADRVFGQLPPAGLENVGNAKGGGVLGEINAELAALHFEVGQLAQMTDRFSPL